MDLATDPGQPGRVEVAGRGVVSDGDEGVTHRRRPADPDLEEGGSGGADLGKRGLGRRDERDGRQERQAKEKRECVFHGCLPLVNDGKFADAFTDRRLDVVDINTRCDELA